MTKTASARPRDPQRAERILAAARELAREQGYDSLTHRSVAARAGVPLGSTTYYFTSIEDLLAQATEQEIDAYRSRAREILSAARGTPTERVIALVTGPELNDGGLVSVDLYFTALARPGLRVIAQRWNDATIEVLADVLPYPQALAVSCFLAGVTLRYTLVGPDAGFTPRFLEDGIRALLEGDEGP